jgi:regulator of replication initiation timing
MIQINFKIVRNGFNVCNVTYGNYNSFEDAAEQISKEATELANASVGYFSQFNKKMVDGDYRFAWQCSWESTDEIVANNGFYICDAANCYNRDRDNNLQWNIVVSTSTSLQDVPKYLGME